ncbi:MAG: hypothetical protein EAZ70_13675, partial [Runella slithyformis]
MQKFTNSQSLRRSFGCLILVFLFGITVCHSQTLSGTVYRDYNANGVLNANEQGVQGVSVRAFDASGAQVGATATSGTTGAWSIATGTSARLRIQFSLPATNANPAGPLAGLDFEGAVSSTGTNVQFFTGGSSGVNFGINFPNDYCQPNPNLIVPCYESGAATLNNNKGIVTTAYNNSGNSLTGISGVANVSEVGTVWGMGWSAQSKRMFASAVLKRHSGLGPRGMGGVYVMDMANLPGNVATSFTLQGVSPVNGGAAIDLGTVNRSGGSDFTLPNSTTATNRDIDALLKVGFAGYGDAEVTEDGKELWLVNLNQRALIKVDISVPSTYPPSASAPVSQYSILGMAGAPSCPNGSFRPWALKFNRGVGYLGVVCNASIGTNSDLLATIYSFDPNNPVALTKEKEFSLAYTREFARDFGVGPDLGVVEPAGWKPWITAWPNVSGTTNAGVPYERAWPQPMLTDIEFTQQGNMVLGIADRWGFQTGFQNGVAISGSNLLISGVNAGDILHLCNVNGGWLWEGQTGACPENDNAAGVTSRSIVDSPGEVGEFFYQDSYNDTNFSPTWNHDETALGGLTVLKGSNEVVSGHYNPIDGIGLNNSGLSTAFTSGLVFHNTTTGARTDQLLIIPSSYNSTAGFASQGKATSLGDMELICNLPPIMIGNRVWEDLDNDGIQDANEPGIPGVQVILTGPGLPSSGVSVTTNSNGEYYFTDAAGSNTTGFSYNLPLANLNNYTLTFPTTVGLLAISTKPNIGSDNTINSKPNPSTGIVSFTLGNKGQNNYIFDAGYYTATCPFIPPPVGTNRAICVGQPIPALTVTVGAGQTVDWYTVPTGGSFLVSGSLSYTPAGAGTFYAETRNIADACTSSTRTAVSLTVNPLPTLSLSGTPTCAPNLFTYSVTFSSNGTVTASEGTIIGNTVSNITLGAALTLTATSSAGCVRTLVVNPPNCTCPVVNPPVGPNRAICVGQPIPALTVTVGAGETVDWYSAPTGGSLLAATTLSYTPVGAGTFYAETRNIADGCKSSTRTAVSLTVSPLPTLSLNGTATCAPNLLTYSVSFTSNGTVTASAG